MKAVIITGGSVNDYEYIKKQIGSCDTIICADSGYTHAVRMGLRPSIVVGDFDSAGEIPGDVSCLRFPSRKDVTDTEIAIDYARSKGFSDFLLIGAIGTRLDHSLSNILLLKSILERGEKAVIIDEHNKIMITDSFLRIYEPPGSIVSLIPLSDCRGVTTENLEYPLRDALLSVGNSLGVSNIMTTDNAAVSVGGGVLLVIVAKD